VSRVGEVPVYAQREDRLEAELYNLWRRARLHLPLPIRFDVPGHAGAEMIIEEHEWVCVNGLQNDLPILAWVEFEDEHRDALHLPVPCKLNYYHFAASRLRAAALEAARETLDELLHPKRGES